MKKLNEKLRAKLSKSGGFTLVEMLIVVAIIAILVAVSIPMFSSTLEKARHGVDTANVRDVISLATLEYLGDPNPTETFKGGGKTYSYDVNSQHQGDLVPNGTTGVKSQCTCSNHPTESQFLTVTIKVGTSGKPDITLNWEIQDDGSTKYIGT